MNANSETTPRDPAKVQEMFGKISKPYDCINRLFSLGIDVYWRKQLAVSVAQNQPKSVLDLATGSGDVALLLQKQGYDVTGMDFCAPMLELAKKKGVKKLLQGDAMNMPFPDNSFDAITIAFGFRNFVNYELALKEIRRVLKPGGMVHILEFSNPSRWFCGLYYFYLSKVMPFMAGLISRNPKAYSYLANSVEKFPDAESLSWLLAVTGYEKVSWQKYTFGIVAIHHGSKK
ncbi:MAG: bifunctional demethylmenaquinone methyltransferase/2-methoxy-6-polyprenyl-1,4-benzoquinol methylase UbiE [Verrucomicrobiales bacterium]|nr:bifunctional demethylmenaquinone methyltransferase/2-methoxy-6-polyprenyl-1,4-benzoquinol methylase UbiE [Verrucomicrobiales bacterium]